MKGTSITFDYNMTDFLHNAEALSKVMHRELTPVLKEMTGSFANVAAQWTPYAGLKQNEVMGRHNTIRRKDMRRRVVDLKNPGSYQLDRIDYIQLSKGMRFKVIFDRKGLKKVRQSSQGIYFMRAADANRAAKMTNVGLARAMWRKKCCFYWRSSGKIHHGRIEHVSRTKLLGLQQDDFH